MNDAPIHWEHYVEIIEASSEYHPEYVHQFYPSGNVPMYAIQSIIPRLNALGEQGWELVQTQPVFVGSNGDILIGGSEYKHWSRTYLCTFKRVIRTS
ncbi:MAG TPA: hypothetical protein VKR06_23335 [Ktedonosporobacter sp.]|nr:hypothetical protein [Ktedonosporobacter sp.]